ncbi:MAG: hypothetical protein U5J63_16690 [Fodinibius sp.]|nr:hypothetical protein [Fodinibius sp.]
MTKNESHSQQPKSSTNPLPWIGGAVLVLGLAIAAGLYWNSTMKVHQVQFSGILFCV